MRAVIGECGWRGFAFGVTFYRKDDIEELRTLYVLQFKFGRRMLAVQFP